MIRRRCGRQRELANPAIIKRRLNVKKIFAYSATIISWIRSFCHSFFFLLLTKTIFCYLPQKSPRATFCHFCWHFALSLLDKILTPLKGEIKQKQDWFIAFIWEYSLLSYSLTTFKLRASSLHMLGESVEYGWTNKLKALTFVHANQDLPETALTAQVK